MTPSKKHCSVCGLQLPRSEFYAHPTYADGLQHICKGCHKTRLKLLRRTTPSVQARDAARSRQRRSACKTHHRENMAIKRKARTAVANALRNGNLQREPCVFCASTVTLQAHHRDYSKPLVVVWLCARCHSRLHAHFPETTEHST